MLKAKKFHWSSKLSVYFPQPSDAVENGTQFLPEPPVPPKKAKVNMHHSILIKEKAFSH
jgi:hypothetical protein